MDLPKQAIIEFQKLYQKKSGVKLSKTEAEKGAEELLTLTMLSQDPNYHL